MADHFPRVLIPRYKFEKMLHVTPATVGSHQNEGYAVFTDHATQRKVIGLACRHVANTSRPEQATPLDEFIQTLSQLRHPMLAEYVEHYFTKGEEAHITFYAFDEFISLQDFMERNGSISEYRIIGFIGSQIASALLYLHTNGHRVGSLNPYKILLNQKYDVKLIDYLLLPDGIILSALNHQSYHQKNEAGINLDMWKATELRGYVNVTHGQQKQKTPEWNALDVLNHAMGAADVYSLGCILYFMMKNRYPTDISFEEDVMGMIVYASPKTRFLLILIRRCCLPQPRERINIASLLDQLQQLSLFQDDSVQKEAHDIMNRDGVQMINSTPKGHQPSSHFTEPKYVDKAQNSLVEPSTANSSLNLDYSNQPTKQSSTSNLETTCQLKTLEELKAPRRSTSQDTGLQETSNSNGGFGENKLKAPQEMSKREIWYPLLVDFITAFEKSNSAESKDVEQCLLRLSSIPNPVVTPDDLSKQYIQVFREATSAYREENYERAHCLYIVCFFKKSSFLLPWIGLEILYLENSSTFPCPRRREPIDDFRAVMTRASNMGKITSFEMLRHLSGEDDYYLIFVAYCMTWGIGIKKNPAEALRLLAQQASCGDAYANYTLGYFYRRGQFVEKDAKKSFSYFYEGSKKRHSSSYNELAYCYKKGEGVAPNLSLAVTYYQMSAEMNNPNAMCNLAFCFKRGEGVPMSIGDYTTWITNAANRGHSASQLALSHCYKRGEGVPKSLSNAFEWLVIAAEQRNAEALSTLGTWYLNGTHVNQDTDIAVKYYKEAAKEGNSYAIEYLRKKSPAAGSSGRMDNTSSHAELLDGRYELFETIGQGLLTKVKRAVDIYTGEEVAVKVIHKDLIAEQKDFDNIAREMYVLRALDHPHVIRLHCVLDTEMKTYLVMEYASRGDLLEHILATGPMAEDLARVLVQQMLLGLVYLHMHRVTHRDLKLENILLDRNGNVKLADFGMAHYARGPNQLLHTCCGSPTYAAPEVISRSPYQGPSADVWSLGVVLYALLCANFPFEDDNLALLYDKIRRADYPPLDSRAISPDAIDLVSRILIASPNERIQLQDLVFHPWLQFESTTAHRLAAQVRQSQTIWADLTPYPPAIFSRLQAVLSSLGATGIPLESHSSESPTSLLIDSSCTMQQYAAHLIPIPRTEQTNTFSRSMELVFQKANGIQWGLHPHSQILAEGWIPALALSQIRLPRPVQVDPSAKEAPSSALADSLESPFLYVIFAQLGETLKAANIPHQRVQNFFLYQATITTTDPLYYAETETPPEQSGSEPSQQSTSATRIVFFEVATEVLTPTSDCLAVRLRDEIGSLLHSWCLCILVSTPSANTENRSQGSSIVERTGITHAIHLTIDWTNPNVAIQSHHQSTPPQQQSPFQLYAKAAHLLPQIVSFLTQRGFKCRIVDYLQILCERGNLIFIGRVSSVQHDADKKQDLVRISFFRRMVSAHPSPSWEMLIPCPETQTQPGPHSVPVSHTPFKDASPHEIHIIRMLFDHVGSQLANALQPHIPSPIVPPGQIAPQLGRMLVSMELRRRLYSIGAACLVSQDNRFVCRRGVHYFEVEWKRGANDPNAVALHFRVLDSVDVMNPFTAGMATPSSGADGDVEVEDEEQEEEDDHNAGENGDDRDGG